MKFKLYTRCLLQRFRMLAMLVLFISFWQFGQAQVTVLPTNGTGSPQSSPQGAQRFQRAFYLITPAEMQASGIGTNTNVNSIGFTLGFPQSFITKGAFRVYLKNTTDTVGRSDTAWTTVDVMNGADTTLLNLVSSDYEWQVKANCSASSGYSPSANFSTANLSLCQPPSNAITTNIGTTTATFEWNAPSSIVNKYYVRYTRLDVEAWTLDSTTTTSYNAIGLVNGKSYQWRVFAACASGKSDSTGSSFATASSACGTIAGLSVGTVTGTTAQLTWNIVPDITSYTVRFRRAGTEAWFTANSLTNSTTIDTFLVPGTRYEWAVNAFCSSGAGVFTSGTPFTTLGTSVCYTPEGLAISNITAASAAIRWTAVTGASSYSIRYRAKNVISWTNAINGMTQFALNDSLVIPATTGKYNIPFASDFNYTGQGVYVAWEYSYKTGALPQGNISLSTDRNAELLGVNGQDSVNLLRSFVASGDTSLPNVLPSTKSRPETTFGSNQFADSVEVKNVYSLGEIAPAFTNDTIRTLIRNKAGSSKPYTINLTVKNALGNVRFTDHSDITIGADTVQLVSFDNWAPTVMETDSIIVSIATAPGENVTANNRNFYMQHVNGSLISYADNSPALAETGFGTTGGFILAKHKMTSCGSVNSARVYLTSSSVGNSVFAVLLNDAGAILSSSDTIVVSESSANQYQSFYFPNPVSLSNATYFIGLGQVANTSTGYNPVGTQWEGDSVRNGAYYRSKSTADSLWESKSAGRPMIMAEVIPQSGSVKITGKLTLCPSESNLLTAVAMEKRFANKVLDYSSQHSTQVYGAANALGSPDVYPAYGLNGNSWTSATADNDNAPNNGREYLVLQFPNPGHINFIEIFQTLNPGAIDSVYIKDPVNGYVNVYTHTAAPEDTFASIKRIDLTETSYDVSEVRIALNSAAVPGFNTIDAVAIGKESSAAFDTYLWTPGGETGSTKSVSSAGTYKVQVTTAAGCTFENSVEVTSHVAVTPTITSYLKSETLHTGAVALCPGDSVILESSQLTGNVWSPGGATTRRIVVFGAGSYTVSYNDGAACGNTTSTPVVVSLNSLPTVSISGTLTICPGNSTTLDAGSHSSYLWNTGANTQTLNVSTPGDYSVIVSNAAGCKASTTATTTFTSLAAPTITGTLSFCEGTTTSLDAGTGYATYAWSSGQTTHNITVSTPGDYSVEVTNTAGCLASNSVTTQKFNNPVPTISGNTGFCPSGNVTLTATPGFVNYAWTPSGSGNTKIISAAGPYTVTVTDANGCLGSAIRQIVQYPAPTPSVAGTLSFCGGSFTLLSAIGGSYTNYSWNTGATTPNISVSAVQTYTVTVTDINGCIASASATTSRTGQVPPSPGPIGGASIVTCSTQGVYTISAVSNTDHYVWTPPRGSTIISGQGGLSVTINFPANFQGGKLIVAASNACGQSNTLTERSLSIQSIPDAPGQIAGQANGDCNASRTFSINAVPIATSYTWSVPAGTSITSGQGGTSIILLFPNNFTFGNICVTANNGCGSSTQSCLQVTSVPAVPTAITGPTSICAGANGLVYTIPAVPGATSYLWTVPQGAQISLGQGTTSVTVKWGNREGSVTCIAKNVCANSAAQSLAVTFTACFASGNYEPQVVVRPVPEVISASGGMASVRGMLLEWTMGEPKVETEQNRILLYTQGFHQPLVLGRSNHDSIKVSTDMLNVTVYPNPVTSLLSVRFETTVIQKVSIEIVDVIGRILQKRQSYTGSRVEEFSMRNYVPGSYFLIVKNENGKIISSIKLLKLDK